MQGNNETNVVLQDVGTFYWQISALNVILDQFVDCKFIIHYYRQLTVHKLVKNCIQKFFATAFLWFDKVCIVRK